MRLYKDQEDTGTQDSSTLNILVSAVSNVIGISVGSFSIKERRDITGPPDRPSMEMQAAATATRAATLALSPTSASVSLMEKQQAAWQAVPL